MSSDAARPAVRSHPRTLDRFGRFNLVGAAGIMVQVAVLSLAVHGLSLHYLGATGVAVTVAVLHNFVWHWRWTWRDRAIPAAAAPQALLRFALVNGGLSLMANLVLMRWLVGTAGVPVEPANLLAIATVGLLNFYLGDRAVFRPPRHRPVGSNSGPSDSPRQIGAPSRRIVAVRGPQGARSAEPASIAGAWRRRKPLGVSSGG